MSIGSKVGGVPSNITFPVIVPSLPFDTYLGLACPLPPSSFLPPPRRLPQATIKVTPNNTIRNTVPYFFNIATLPLVYSSSFNRTGNYDNISSRAPIRAGSGPVQNAPRFRLY